MPITLKYFAGRGVAETARVMLAISNTEFEDARFPIDFTNFSKPEFDAAAAEGQMVVNMNRAPVLIYDDVTIGQSKTIERFLARKLGFNGANEAEEASIDMVTEHVRDIKQKYNDAKTGKKDEELEAAKTAFLTTDLPAWLAKLEKSVTNTTPEFFVGSKLSLADITLQQFLVDFFDDKEAAAAAMEACPNIKAAVASVNVAGKAWFESRPVTKF